MANTPTPEQAKALQRISAATRTANALKRAGRDHEARVAFAEAKKHRAAYQALKAKQAPATTPRRIRDLPADFVPLGTLAQTMPKVAEYVNPAPWPCMRRWREQQADERVRN